jgi:hypothetical protein
MAPGLSQGAGVTGTSPWGSAKSAMNSALGNEQPEPQVGHCYKQGTEPPIPIPIPGLPGIGDGPPIPGSTGIGGPLPSPSPICRGSGPSSGVHSHPHPRFARIGDPAEYH